MKKREKALKSVKTYEQVWKVARITSIIIGFSMLPLEPLISRPEVAPKLAQNHPSDSHEEALDAEGGVEW